jgi:hypothetical protein
MLKFELEKKSFWVLFSIFAIILYGLFVLIGEFLYSGIPFEIWINQKYILKWRDVLIPLWIVFGGIFGYFYFKRKRQVIISGEKYYCTNNCGKILEYETQIITDNDNGFCSQKCLNEWNKDLKTR